MKRTLSEAGRRHSRACAREPNNRIHGLDALRGLAVILMLEQHLGSWLWRGIDPGSSLADYAGFLVVNSLGGLAFPLFIGLSGVGNALFAASPRPRIDGTLFRRGIGLYALALTLNLATPTWFSWGSFFALHMIALATLATPLLRRLPRVGLLGLTGLVLVATPLVQYWLATPLQLDNERMRDLTLPGGPLRLALAEGQYPILPWLAVYIGGLVAGRDVLANRTRHVVRLGLVMVLVGAGLWTLHGAGLKSANHPVLARAARLPVPFFPASVTIILLLLGATLLAVAFAASRQPQPLAPIGALSTLGRASLTVFLLHIWLFREVSRPLGFWRAFSPGTTLVVTALVVMLTVILTRRWQRLDYRYGPEWLLRVLAG